MQPDVDRAKHDYALARAAAEQNAELRMMQRPGARTVRDLGVQVGPARLHDRKGAVKLDSDGGEEEGATPWT